MSTSPFLGEESVSEPSSRWRGHEIPFDRYSDTAAPESVLLGRADEVAESEELFESEEFARHAVDEAISALDSRGDMEIDAQESGRDDVRPRILLTAQLRKAWRSYECATHRMVDLRLFGKWNTPVNPETVDAWRALEQALVGAGYRPHRAWVYVCRQIGGQKTQSLHAYGLAIDIDHRQPKCNVNRATPDQRVVKFSRASTKDERCEDVRSERADTSFTEDQVAAVEAIRTVDGHQVFAWGGRWKTCKDTMHFQISVTPAELANGIRPVKGGRLSDGDGEGVH
ncbi:M15 family metallopeptidase [Amycolatopsis sp. NPDC051045]|uniref:M15 family metallopeptidase n=1 Tax=Amycolatopsis sp. NPDC051045 TaxID=3156922 RepID=UPI0034125DBA